MGKVAVFGILKHNDKAYTAIVEDMQKNLLPVIARKVMLDSLGYTGYYRSYDVLDVREFIHCYINHRGCLLTGTTTSTALKFWNQAKRVLRKYNGIDRNSLPPFLKEYEFRFNFGASSEQLKILRK